MERLLGRTRAPFCIPPDLLSTLPRWTRSPSVPLTRLPVPRICAQGTALLSWVSADTPAALKHLFTGQWAVLEAGKTSVRSLGFRNVGFAVRFVVCAAYVMCWTMWTFVLIRRPLARRGRTTGHGFLDCVFCTYDGLGVARDDSQALLAECTRCRSFTHGTSSNGSDVRRCHMTRNTVFIFAGALPPLACGTWCA